MATLADNYILSRNTSEAERLDIQHKCLISCQGYYLHPDIPSPAPGARIADVCTGSTIILREVAPAYPDAEFHGFDITDKMYPTDLPPNVSLHIADVKQPFEDRWKGFFDVVHLRFIQGALRKDDWALVLQNLTALLKPGGWLQWVEADIAHGVRHAARPVAPLNAAKESLAGNPGFLPPRLHTMDRFNRLVMPNGRADDMTYGYMNLDTLMQDPNVGNLEQVGCDVYMIDRQDDGGELRKEYAVMGIDAVASMLLARQEAGDKITDMTREELAQGFWEDISKGGYFANRASVFTGRKKE